MKHVWIHGQACGRIWLKTEAHAHPFTLKPKTNTQQHWHTHRVSPNVRGTARQGRAGLGRSQLCDLRGGGGGCLGRGSAEWDCGIGAKPKLVAVGFPPFPFLEAPKVEVSMEPANDNC